LRYASRMTTPAVPIGAGHDHRDARPRAAGAHAALALAVLGTWLAGLAGCGDDTPPPREVTVDATVGSGGWSEPIEVEVPDGTRSLTLVAEGAPGALYALGELTLSDGVDRIGIDDRVAPGPAMQDSYQVEQIGQMAGGLYQSIRLGTFTQVYPYRPGQVVLAGPARVRVVSDTPGPVRVHAIMAADDGSARLVLNLVLVSDLLPLPDTAGFVTELHRIYAQAGIEVTIGEVERITGSPLARISESTEPQESPTSQTAMLPALTADRDRPGLDVFVVESLPSGIAGLALGTPGPPLRGSYYFGVAVRASVNEISGARVVAHETAHFLALQHVENVGTSGTTYPDPLDDTEPGADNLMSTGTVITPDQAFALSRSALLTP